MKYNKTIGELDWNYQKKRKKYIYKVLKDNNYDYVKSSEILGMLIKSLYSFTYNYPEESK